MGTSNYFNQTPSVWDSSLTLQNTPQLSYTQGISDYMPAGGNLPVNQFQSVAQNTNFGGLTGSQWGMAGQGIMGMANLYNGLQANKLAKNQLAFAKESYATNLANSLKSYNTTLTDKINSRYGVEGKSTDQAAAYLAANKL